MDNYNVLQITKRPDDSSKARTVKQLIEKDLVIYGWKTEETIAKIVLYPPKSFTKEQIRTSMQAKRLEVLGASTDWIQSNAHILRSSLATGWQAYNSPIIPVLEECITQAQLDTFRLCRYCWSSPFSDYVGRRIKFIVRDWGVDSHPVMGIAALGSPLIHIPSRDNWIGWDINTRKSNIQKCMDAYIVGAMPPYNALLGGKLMAYILASNEVRNLCYNKYQKNASNKNSKPGEMVCIFTTSLYGRSSQYNRISYRDGLLYQNIGQTEGYGTLHISFDTFHAMRELLESNGLYINNRFDNGPNWHIRVIGMLVDL
jgi:hypothetical protein